VRVFVVCAGTRVRAHTCQNVCCRGFVGVPACVFVCWLGSVVVVCVCVCVCVCLCVCARRGPPQYGVAAIIRLLKITGLFCRISSLF